MAKSNAFECRKWAWRQTKEGIVVSFLIHPNDIPVTLALAPLGTIYAIGYREMPEGDTSNSDSGHLMDQHKTVMVGLATVSEPAQATPAEPASGRTKGGGGTDDKPRRRFHELSRREQAVLACKDERFQKWTAELADVWPNEHNAADYIRNQCAVQSRRDLDTNPTAAQAWDRLYAQYLRDTGMVAEERT